MPELPEVESVRRALSPGLAGRRIVAATLARPEVAAHPQAEAFCAGVRGRTVCALERRGKFLRARLEDGGLLVVHLRMTGRLLLVPGEEALEAHTHAVFLLDDGVQLRFVDPRRFGRLWLVRADETDTFTGMARLGPEPDDPACDQAYLRAAFGRSRRAIKACLLDQRAVAGIGNIYSDEILFAAGIAPMRAANALDARQWNRLAAAIPETMRFFTAANLVTPEQYRQSAGRTYRNTPYLRVYGHAGDPCPVCGARLESARVAGRASVWCPGCQR